jgi:glycosyltransferase involved in cell wall biosynthesis
MVDKLRVLYFEPLYIGGSHELQARGFLDHTRHNVSFVGRPILTNWLDNYFYGPKVLTSFVKSSIPDLNAIIATDMSSYGHASTICQLLGSEEIPLIINFLEHDFAWPQSQDRKNVAAAIPMLTLASTKVANKILFQTKYSYQSLMDGARKIVVQAEVEKIEAKCQIVPAGVDFAAIEKHRAEKQNEIPTILFNHRCDYDKNWPQFLDAVSVLNSEGVKFDLILTGSPNEKVPEELNDRIAGLKDHVKHVGYVESREEYAKLLWQSDIVCSTSLQECFGISVVEAVYCDCFPILPNRLSYPELIPSEHHDQHLFNSFDELVQLLRVAIANHKTLKDASLHRHVEKFDWSIVAPQIDDVIESVASKNKS